MTHKTLAPVFSKIMAWVAFDRGAKAGPMSSSGATWQRTEMPLFAIFMTTSVQMPASRALCTRREAAVVQRFGKASRSGGS
jgi:hypothetical protein